MDSRSLHDFEHAIKDALDLLKHFDLLNASAPTPPPEAEVMKRASLVMALAALETYVEDRIVEAADRVVGVDTTGGRLAVFYRNALENDLKRFHVPNVERIRKIFRMYFDIDVTEGWTWNNYTPAKARIELDNIAQKRGSIAHRSARPKPGQVSPHVVTREDLRKHIQFIRDLAKATDAHLYKVL